MGSWIFKVILLLDLIFNSEKHFKRNQNHEKKVVPSVRMKSALTGHIQSDSESFESSIPPPYPIFEISHQQQND